jgi:antitoxin PrlF
MATSKITSKGQITLPKPIRDRLGVKPGDRVAFSERPDGSVVVEADTIELMELRGAVRPRRWGIRVEDMAAAIRRGGAGR